MNRSGKRLMRLLSSSPPRHVDDDSWRCGARKGYVPVMVAGERFHIPTRFMSHPSVVALLEKSAHEFGFGQEGVLQIPCEPENLREILKGLGSFRARLVSIY